MAGLLLNSKLTFDFSVSTADQFSTSSPEIGAIDLIGFMWKVTGYTSGKLGVTIQVNQDLPGETVLGWQDLADYDIKVFDHGNSTYLAQSDSNVASGELRGGILGANGTFSISFSPRFHSVSYRLRFEMTSDAVMDVENIYLIQ